MNSHILESLKSASSVSIKNQPPLPRQSSTTPSKINSTSHSNLSDTTASHHHSSSKPTSVRSNTKLSVSSIASSSSSSRPSSSSTYQHQKSTDSTTTTTTTTTNGNSGNSSHTNGTPNYQKDSGIVKLYLRGRPINFHLPKSLAATFEPSAILKSPKDVSLKLEWVYGYRGKDCRSNVYQLQTGECVYFVAAVAVLFNSEERTQRHYLGHTDDIKSMAIHPDRIRVATGQCAGKHFLFSIIVDFLTSYLRMSHKNKSIKLIQI